MHQFRQRSVMLLSQFPVSDWHGRFADPTLADAILDRLIHNAIRFELTGPSMRKLSAGHASSAEGLKAGTSLRSDSLEINES